MDPKCLLTWIPNSYMISASAGWLIQLLPFFPGPGVEIKAPEFGGIVTIAATMNPELIGWGIKCCDMHRTAKRFGGWKLLHSSPATKNYQKPLEQAQRLELAHAMKLTPHQKAEKPSPEPWNNCWIWGSAVTTGSIGQWWSMSIHLPIKNELSGDLVLCQTKTTEGQQLPWPSKTVQQSDEQKSFRENPAAISI